MSHVVLISIGKHMPRNKYQYPKVQKTGRNPNQWEGRYAVYEVVDGEQKRRQRRVLLGLVREMKEQEAQEKLDAMVRAETNTPSSGEVTVWEFIHKAESGYIAMRQARWTPKWKDNALSLYDNHFKESIGKLKLKDVNRTNFQSWLDKFGASGYSATLIKRCRTQLSAILQEAFVQGLITGNFFEAIGKRGVIVDPKTTHKTVRPVATLQQMAAALKFTLRRKNHKDYLILRLTATRGLRPSETFALRVNDIQDAGLMIDEKVVNYILGETKTTDSEALVPLTTDLRRELETYVCSNSLSGDDFLFTYATGLPMSQNNYVRRQMKTIGKAIGLPGLNFRMLRRSFSTFFKKHGDPKDLQCILRHSDVTTSLEIYQQEIPAETLKAAESYDREILALEAA